MSSKRFGSMRRLPSGAVQARHRPRKGQHHKATFDTFDEAERWLDQLQAQLAKEREANGARGTDPRSEQAT